MKGISPRRRAAGILCTCGDKVYKRHGACYTTYVAKFSERTRAIHLRKQGKSYREILSEVVVAKSTLSLWLRSVGLAKKQKQRLTQKRLNAVRRAAAQKRAKRIDEVNDYIQQGMREITSLTPRELWLIGVALYWAEGSKQNRSSVSAQVQFGNSDVRMIRVFLHWLRSLNISVSDMHFELYVHDNRKSEIEDFRRWWMRELGITRSQLDRIYFKRDKPNTKRTNVGDLYHGLLRIRVRSSTILNRKINGWVAGIVATLPARLMVGRQPLALNIGVRIPGRQI